MKLNLKTVAATVALTLGAPAAMAIDSPTFGGTAGPNGSLFITVFDTVAGNSLVQVLTPATSSPSTSFAGGSINYGEFGESTVTPDGGLTLTFNLDLSVLTGSNPSNLRYTIFSGDASGSTIGGQGVLFTAQSGLAGSSGLTNGFITAMNGSSGAGQIAATFGAASSGVGLSNGPGYFGNDFWGASFGAVGFLDGSAALNSSLAFYQGLKTGTDSAADATVTQYANVNGNATWTLSSAGLLTYNVPGGTSEVPLPAAVWLLLSGVGGLGVLGRRRRAVAA